MKRILIFAGLALAGFGVWQWVLSRRTNKAASSYYETTAGSVRRNRDANNSFLEAVGAIAPALAVVKDIRGVLFNGNKTAPLLTRDGYILSGTDKTSDDLSEDQGEETTYFGI